MPVLADLDDPPRSRAKGLLLGFALGLVLLAAIVLWLLPTLVEAVVGGARDFDARLREQDAYIAELCGLHFEPARDEKLCGCAFATEFPSLDCQDPFRRWLLAQQSLRCADEATGKSALSFCSCVEFVAKEVHAAADDDDAARRQAQAYDRCLTLPDRLDLPPLVGLAEPAKAEGENPAPGR